LQQEESLVPMAVPHLPDDLLAYLQAAAPATLDGGGYGKMTLFQPEELQMETLTVKLFNAPFADEDLHHGEFGYYAVPAINLVHGEPRAGMDFPAWIFLWLPVERRYGSFDPDHGDVVMFAPQVRWTDIAGQAESFALASDGSGDGPVTIEYLRPWPKYPFVQEEYPFNEEVS
jgi:hypothetical protein